MVVLTKNHEEWVVEYPYLLERDFQQFSSIEAASAFMIKFLNVNDDSIDDAIIEMAGFDRTKAVFNDKGLLQETR